MKTIYFTIFILIYSNLLNAVPVGSSFSYQGQLTLNDVPVTGTYDLKFELWTQETGGGIFGNALFTNDVAVTKGIFTVDLDFGSAPFSGEDYFLKIQVREGSSTGSYTALYPKQRINATPYAVQADYLAANGATNGQVLKFNGTDWVAGTDNSSSSPWQGVNGGTRFIDGNVAIGANTSAFGSTLLLLDAATGDDPLRIKLNGSTKMRIYNNGGTSLGGNTSPSINGLVVQGDILARSDVNVSGKMDITGDTNASIATLKLDGANPLRVDVNGLTKMTVLANGGTGLGGGTGSLNNVPDNGLYVNGDIQADSDLNLQGKPIQPVGSHGFAKAGAKFMCGSIGTTIFSSFNNVNNGIFIVTKSIPVIFGRCTITFPFDISQHYYQITTNPNLNFLPEFTTCKIRSGSSTQLDCRVFNAGINATDGIISVLLF